MWYISSWQNVLLGWILCTVEQCCNVMVGWTRDCDGHISDDFAFYWWMVKTDLNVLTDHERFLHVCSCSLFL
jgi:hypothetical protein